MDRAGIVRIKKETPSRVPAENSSDFADRAYSWLRHGYHVEEVTCHGVHFLNVLLLHTSGPAFSPTAFHNNSELFRKYPVSNANILLLK
jgi:hypothetical protein